VRSARRETDQRTGCGTHSQLNERCGYQAPPEPAAGPDQLLRQHSGQNDGHRVVGAGFEFQCRTNASLEVNTAAAQHSEHRRRTG